MAELNFESLKEKVTGFFGDLAHPQSDASLPDGLLPENEAIPEGLPPEEETPSGLTPEEGDMEEPNVQKQLGTKIAQRFLGTDVEDPVELPRLAAQISFAVAGGILGSRIPTAPGPAGFFVNPVTGSIVGSLSGLMLGTVAPETALYLASETGVIDDATREKLSLSPSELKTVLEGERSEER